MRLIDAGLIETRHKPVFSVAEGMGLIRVNIEGVKWTVEMNVWSNKTLSHVAIECKDGKRTGKVFTVESPSSSYHYKTHEVALKQLLKLVAQDAISSALDIE